MFKKDFKNFRIEKENFKLETFGTNGYSSSDTLDIGNAFNFESKPGIKRGWKFYSWEGVPEWIKPAAIFLCWRTGLAILAFAAGGFYPAFALHNGVAPYNPPALQPWAERLLGVWSHWDGEWFLYIAQNGYKAGEPTAPFFPLYPLLVKGVSLFSGFDYLLAGVAAAALFSFTACLLLYRLSKFEFGEKIAGRTLIYFLIFPTSFFVTATYSEGLFLTLCLGAFLAARRYSNWWVCGLLVGLASVTRNLGLALLVPLGLEWIRQNVSVYPKFLKNSSVGDFNPSKNGIYPGLWKFKLINARLKLNGFTSLVPFLGLPAVIFGSWLNFQSVVFHDRFSFVNSTGEWMWERHFSFPWDTISKTLGLLSANADTDPAHIYFLENHNWLDFGSFLIAALTFAGACYLTKRKELPLIYSIWLGIAALVPVLSPVQYEPLQSYPRYILLAFPAFWVLTRIGLRWKIFNYLYISTGIFLMVIVFSRFSGWYWIA